MYIKNAFYYWRKHKSMYLSMLVTIVLGMMAVMIAAFLIRSQVVTKLEETLNNGGFYDLAVYDVSNEVKEAMKKDNRFESIGMVSCLGQAVSENGIEFSIGSVENKATEKMLHLTPIEGRYPEKAGEITLDRITMQCMGMKPETGGVIQLELRNKDKKILSKEYTIVGIIEQRYMSEEGFIYCRRRYDATETGEGAEDYIACPYGYVHPSEIDIFQSAEQEILFANVKTGQGFDETDIITELLEKYGEDLKLDFNSFGRSHYADVLLGYKNVEEMNVAYGYQEALERIGSDTTKKDFYSRVLIPLFSILIAVISFFSLYEAFGSFILSRRKEIGMYRCLGMNKRQVLGMVIMELLYPVIPGLFLGCAGGLLGYGGILLVANQIFDLGMQQAFILPEYFAPFIKAATLSPFGISIGLTLITVLCSVSIPLKKSVGLSPMEVCKKEGATKKESMKYQVALGINVSLLIVSITVGYLYFVSERRFENEQLAEMAGECLIDGSDYMMEKESSYAAFVGMGDEIRHDAGITKENMEQLKENPMVERIHKATVCHGTHLVYQRGKAGTAVSEFLEPALQQFVMNEDSETERWYALRFKRDKAYKGFKEKEDIYQVPTVALDKQEWTALFPYVTEGEIHQEALKNGKEVVLVYSGETEIPFRVGDELPMNVVVYPRRVDESAEYKATGKMENEEPTYPGDAKHLEQYCYGKRQDWKVKVGAILYLDDPELYRFYSGESFTGLQIFTRTEALEVWNMPDRNYTKVAVKLCENADRQEFENQWYQLISKGKIMTTKSLEGISNKMTANTWNGRVIFISMSGMIIIISLLGILNALRMQVLQEKKRMSVYRALGATKKRMKRKLQKKQFSMVMIGAILAEAATLGILYLRIYLDKQIEAYLAGNIEKETDWWGFEFPFTRIEQEDCMVAVVVSFVLFLLMAEVAGGVYQHRINRETIAEGLREE